MRIPLPHVLRRKTRWFRQADAYVDGRVTPVERDLFEERLEVSPELQEHLHETRELKQLVNSLPEHPVPRSFAINPGMLAEFDANNVPLAPRVALRLAQATAVVAIASLATVGFIDASNNATNGSDDSAPAAEDLEESRGNGAGEQGDVEGGAAPESSGDANGGVDSLGDADGADDSAGGEGANSAGSNDQDDAGSSAADDESQAPRSDDRAEESSPVTTFAEERGADGDTAQTVTYATLASVTVLALGVWIFSRRLLRNYR